MEQTLQDAELLRRIATGDRDAMRLFYERHQSQLTGFIRARGMDPATAADVVQDAMLEVWRSASRYRGEAAAKTWLFTIARNKIVDRTRKGARVQYMDEVPDSIDETPNPEDIAVSVSEEGRVRACLDRLKEAHKTVMRLAFYDDLTYEEIATVEDVPIGTIKTRIFHAKKLLLRCLGTR